MTKYQYKMLLDVEEHEKMVMFDEPRGIGEEANFIFQNAIATVAWRCRENCQELGQHSPCYSRDTNWGPSTFSPIYSTSSL
jgi:hypothetical protein